MDPSRARRLRCLSLALLVTALAGAVAAQETPPSADPPETVAAGGAAAGEPGAPAAGAAGEPSRAPATAGGGAPGPAAPSGESPAGTAPAGTAAAGTATAASRVVAVHRLLVEETGNEETAEAAGTVPARPVGLGAVIAVEVAGLDALIAAAGGFDEVVLFLDGIPLAGMAPLGVRPDRGWLIYRLDRSDSDDEAWHLLLGSPSSLVRRLSLSLGADVSHPIPTDVEDFPLAVIYGWELTIFVVLLVAAVVGFVLAARRTDLLRDRAAEVPAGAVRPYSLARCQMALWFFLVVAAYVFIWLALDELDTITPSVLALIGIGSGTALGAAMIDGQKKQSQEEAEAALGQLETAAAAPESAADPTAQVARQMQMAHMEQRVADLQGSVKGGSRGFTRDLLWDGGGMSLHRFQILVWTLVLGVIFAASVYFDLAMPDFSATLLGLMGISSGTYLGFKFPERQQ